jgi:hypothetical protein
VVHGGVIFRFEEIDKALAVKSRQQHIAQLKTGAGVNACVESGGIVGVLAHLHIRFGLGISYGGIVYRYP